MLADAPSFSETERKMRGKTYIIKGVRTLVLTGVLGTAVLGPAGTAFAIGPGESAFISSEGPGGSREGQDNAGPGAGDAGNSQTSEGSKTAAPSNPNAWKKVNGVYQMPDGSAIPNVLARGIDVSRWQGDIDWKQVAADDVSFVMLGTRSKGAVDPYFHKNIQQASAAGIKVGVYIYSLAADAEMARQEADFVLDLIHDYPVSYPVAFDMEDSAQGALSKEQLAEIANAFCSRISEAGYYPIIYANDNWLANKLDMGLMDYPVWVARYSARPVYANPVMWQATSSGSVKGIGGNVDIDFQYKDFSSVIPADTWRTIGGKTYYYKDHVKQKNSWVDDNGTWYYMDGDGLKEKGWITLAGKSYYLNEDTGKMMTGWRQEDGAWYYLGSSGAMETGWIQDNGTWYHADSRGVMQTSWLEENGNTYFLKNSGAMAVGWIQDNGRWYYFGSSGTMQKGWIQDNGTWYYADSKGAMQTGWLEENGSTYYLRGSGAMATGWRQMDGSWYYFDGSGRMVTGWQKLGDIWYYFDGSGRMAEGIIELGGIQYYLEPGSGKMAADTTVEIGGQTYEAGADGSLRLPAEGEQPSNEAQSGQQPSGTAGTGSQEKPQVQSSKGPSENVSSGTSSGGPGESSSQSAIQGSAPGSGDSTDIIITPIGN